MQRGKWIIGILSAVLVMVAAAWWFGWFGEDRAVATARQARDELFQNRDQMSDEQRRAAFQQFRQQLDGLSDDQRRQLFRDRRAQFETRMRERLNGFFDMSPQEQDRELDRIIDQMSDRRANRPPRAGNRGGRGGGGRGGMTDAQREDRRKGRLDRSDPRVRAQMSEFRRRLNDRLAQRGLPPARGGRGTFGGGGRRT